MHWHKAVQHALWYFFRSLLRIWWLYFSFQTLLTYSLSPFIVTLWLLFYCSFFSSYVPHYLFSIFFVLTLLIFYTLPKLYSLMSDIMLPSTSSFLLPGSGEDNTTWPFEAGQGHLTGSGQWHMPLLMETCNACGNWWSF